MATCPGRLPLMYAGYEVCCKDTGVKIYFFILTMSLSLLRESSTEKEVKIFCQKWGERLGISINSLDRGHCVTHCAPTRPITRKSEG